MKKTLVLSAAFMMLSTATVFNPALPCAHASTMSQLADDGTPAPSEALPEGEGAQAPGPGEEYVPEPENEAPPQSGPYEEYIPAPNEEAPDQQAPPDEYYIPAPGEEAPDQQAPPDEYYIPAPDDEGPDQQMPPDEYVPERQGGATDESVQIDDEQQLVTADTES